MAAWVLVFVTRAFAVCFSSGNSFPAFVSRQNGYAVIAFAIGSAFRTMSTLLKENFVNVNLVYYKVFKINLNYALKTCPEKSLRFTNYVSQIEQ